MKRPTKALVGLPIGGAPSISHRPNRGPNIHAAIKAEAPPTRWTGPLPAMSTTPIFIRNPWGDQTQWAGIQYTTVLTKENRQYALKLHLQMSKNIIFLILRWNLILYEKCYDNQYFHFEKLVMAMVPKWSFLHVLNDSRWFRTFFRAIFDLSNKIALLILRRMFALKAKKAKN